MKNALSKKFPYPFFLGKTPLICGWFRRWFVEDLISPWLSLVMMKRRKRPVTASAGQAFLWVRKGHGRLEPCSLSDEELQHMCICKMLEHLFFFERCDYNVRHPEQWWMIWRWLPSSFQKKRCGIPAPAFATDNKKKGLARRLPDIAWYVVSLFLHASAARCREHPEEMDVSGFPLFFSFCFRLGFQM